MGATQASDPVVAAATKIDGYWYQDGINEITAGIGFLSASAVAYMVHRQLVSTTDWAAVAIGVGGGALGFTEDLVKKVLRERFSYPRIGYLSELRGEPLSRRRKVIAVTFLIVAVLIPIAAIALMKDHHRPAATRFGWMRWLPMVMGFGLFFGGIIDYKRFRLPRLVITGSLVMLAGVASSVFIDAAFLPWVGAGFASAVISIVSGLVALASLVRTVPVSTE
jgi:hypothetical protein